MQSSDVARLRVAVVSARYLFVVACLNGFLPSEAAIAQSGRVAPTGLIVFDIPAQPLDQALDTFSAASGLQVFYENSLTSGRHSAPVKGVFEAERALRRLLWGSGVTARVIAPGTISLAAPDNAGAASLPQQQADPAYLSYYGSLQASVMKALCGRTETRPGNYHIALQYWIDRRGRIARFKLIGSSGSDERDAAIIGAVQGLVLPPPGDMPQPVTMAIEPTQPVVGCASADARVRRGP
jgi:hypothetical protein